jgi:hypothetical protein
MASSTHSAGLSTGTIFAREKKMIRTAKNCNGAEPGMNTLKPETTQNARGKGVSPSGLASYLSRAETFVLFRLVAVIDFLRSTKA